MPQPTLPWAFCHPSLPKPNAAWRPGLRPKAAGTAAPMGNPAKPAHFQAKHFALS